MRQKPTHPGDEAFHEAFGRALKVLRAERGLERKDLAEAAGLSYPYVSEIETGRKRPSSRAVLALAEALGVPPHHLWEVADALQTKAAMARREPERARPSFFHASETVPAAAVEPPPASATSIPRPAKTRRLRRPRSSEIEVAEGAAAGPETAPLSAASERDRLVDALVAAAGNLPERDLEHLVELARRLAR